MNKVLLVVMDGVGISKTGLGDAVTAANTPTLDWLRENMMPYYPLGVYKDSEKGVK